MKIKALLIAVIVLGTFAWSFGQEQDIVSLTLEDCILKAMEGNLQVAVEEYKPRLAEASVVQAKGIFFPQLDLTYGKNNTESPSYWWLQGEDTQITKFNN